MSYPDTRIETKAKIVLDEANLAFAETAQRKDTPGNRTLEGSSWEAGRMEGEFDEQDFHRILELQMQSARICDNRPDLEQKTSEMFREVNPSNALKLFNDAIADPDIRELARISVVIFLARFPTVESYVNKGHPLVLATDEYMLENANKQNWYDFNNLAHDLGWN